MKWIIAVVMLACELVMGQDNYHKIPQAGLILDFLDQGLFNSAYAFNTASQNSGTGTSVVLTGATKGLAMVANGSTSRYDFGVKALLCPQTVSILIWCKPSTTAINWLMGAASAGTTYVNYGIWTYGNKIQFYHTNGWYERSNIFPVYANDSWICIGITRDINMNLVMSMNGIVYPITVDLSGGGGKTPNLTTEGLAIGRVGLAATTYSGKIGRCLIWSRKISNAEMMEAYQATRGNYK